MTCHRNSAGHSVGGHLICRSVKPVRRLGWRMERKKRNKMLATRPKEKKKESQKISIRVLWVWSLLSFPCHGCNAGLDYIQSDERTVALVIMTSMTSWQGKLTEKIGLDDLLTPWFPVTGWLSDAELYDWLCEYLHILSPSFFCLLPLSLSLLLKAGYAMREPRCGCRCRGSEE